MKTLTLEGQDAVSTWVRFNHKPSNSLQPCAWMSDAEQRFLDDGDAAYLEMAASTTKSGHTETLKLQADWFE